MCDLVINIVQTLVGQVKVSQGLLTRSLYSVLLLHRKQKGIEPRNFCMTIKMIAAFRLLSIKELHGASVNFGRVRIKYIYCKLCFVLAEPSTSSSSECLKKFRVYQLLQLLALVNRPSPRCYNASHPSAHRRNF